MRTFDDPQGQRWQAALLEASYGHIMLLFNPLEGSDVRQKLLDADHLAEAEQWLPTVDDKALRELLAQASPWDPATSGNM